MSAFVGRSTELKRLGAALSRAIGGQGELVVLAGEAGAGKSSLLQQFILEATTQHPNLRVLATQCSEQYGADEPYQPFISAFRDLLADPDGAGPQRGFADYARTLAPYWLGAIPIAGGLIAAATATAVELKKNKRNVRELARELAPYWLQAIPGAGSMIAAAASTAAELSNLSEKEAAPAAPPRSEERRVGKEGRSRWCA